MVEWKHNYCIFDEPDEGLETVLISPLVEISFMPGDMTTRGDIKKGFLELYFRDGREQLFYCTPQDFFKFMGYVDLKAAGRYVKTSDQIFYWEKSGNPELPDLLQVTQALRDRA